MKIVDASVYSKEELVEIINHILNAKYEFAKYHYMVDYQHEKKKRLLNQAEELVKKMKSFPSNRQGLIERVELGKKIDKIHEMVDRIEKSIVID